MIRRLRPGGGQHRRRRIDGDDSSSCADGLRESLCHNTRAAADVEDPRANRYTEQADEISRRMHELRRRGKAGVRRRDMWIEIWRIVGHAW
jgi:hypothetical protein